MSRLPGKVRRLVVCESGGNRACPTGGGGVAGWRERGEKKGARQAVCLGRTRRGEKAHACSSALFFVACTRATTRACAPPLHPSSTPLAAGSARPRSCTTRAGSHHEGGRELGAVSATAAGVVKAACPVGPRSSKGRLCSKCRGASRVEREAGRPRREQGAS